MAPKQSSKLETKTEERATSEKRQRDNPRDIWDIDPDKDTDERVIITDWASI